MSIFFIFIFSDIFSKKIFFCEKLFCVSYVPFSTDLSSVFLFCKFFFISSHAPRGPVIKTSTFYLFESSRINLPILSTERNEHLSSMHFLLVKQGTIDTLKREITIIFGHSILLKRKILKREMSILLFNLRLRLWTLPVSWNLVYGPSSKVMC